MLLLDQHGRQGGLAMTGSVPKRSRLMTAGIISIAASLPPSPPPGASYGLPGPVFHRLEPASFLARKQSRRTHRLHGQALALKCMCSRTFVVAPTAICILLRMYRLRQRL